MAIYYYPYPASLLSYKLPQLQIGDFYVTNQGKVSQFTKPGSLGWSSYTGTPAVAGSGGGAAVIPPITASTLVPSTQVSTGQVVNFTPVGATGGSAVATSYTTTGTLIGLTTTVSPALPAGLSITSTPSVVSVVGSDGISRYYNSLSVSVIGTPTAAAPVTTYVVSFTDASGLVSNASFGLTVSAAGSVPVTTTQSISNQTLIEYTTATTFTPITATGGTGALKFTISPNLPTGLTISTSTGAISGYPTAIISPTTFTVTVTDTVGQNSSQSFSLTVNPVLVSTVLVVPSFTAIQSIAITTFTPVTASGGIGALTYTISPSLPVGLSFSPTTGAISGTPGSSSPSTSYTVTVTDSNPTTPQSSSKSFTLVVNALPLLTTTLVSASNPLTRNSAVSFTPVAASGGYISLTYAISPTLPASLVFSTSTGAISGTPTEISSTATYTVTVNDQASQTSSKAFTLSVSSVPLTVTTAIPSTTLTRLVTFTPFTPVTATGGYGTFTWAVSPGLPTGLTFNTSNGQVAGGTSASNAATTYTVSVTDQTPQTSTSSFRLTVNNPNAVTATTVISVTTLSQNTAFTPFSPVTAVGGYGTLNYAITPNLPNGLLYGNGTGIISGTPTAYSSLTNFSVTVSDSLSQSSTSTFKLQVATPPLVTTLAVPSISEYRSIAITQFAPVTVIGGTGVYTFSVTPSLPSGLNFLTATGQIYGTATTSTSATNYTITVTDTLSNTSSQVFNLTVLNPTPVSTYIITTATSLVKLVTNASFSPVGAYGGYGSLSFFVSPTLPTGLSFNSANGRITGTPSVISSTATYTVIVSDSISQNSSTQFTLAVTNPLLTLTATTSSSYIYSFTEYYAVTPFTPVTAIGGSGIYNYSISPSIDQGLTFNTVTSVISGTPTASLSTATYTITVNDGTGATSSTSIRVYIPAPTPLTRVTNATNIVTTITQAITAITPISSLGGVAPISYSISPSLPSGLNFNSNSGQITGTPTALSNNTPYTVTVTDSISQTTSGSFNLIVKPVALTYKLNYPSIVEVQYAAITPFTPVQGQGGYGTLSYTISPSFSQYFGLTFNNGTGQITGTPAQTLSTTSYTVTVADQSGQITTSSFNLIVNPDPPPALQAVLQVPAATFNVNVAASTTPVVGAGGVPGYSYALYPSSLPSGLVFNTSTGAISGSATVSAATATYVVTVTDAVPQSQSQSFTLYSTPLVVTNPNTSNNLNVVGGAGSSSPCTGAVVVHGGTGITGCLNVGGSVNSTGTVSANTVTTTNLNTNNISSTGTVSANTVTTTNVNAGTVTSTGTVTAGNVSTTGTVSANTVTTGNLVSTGTVSAGTINSGNVTSTGTVTAGNVATTGTVSANTVTTTNVNAGTVTSTGTVTAGNVSTTGTVTAGNVSASNVTATNVEIVQTLYANTVSAYIVSATIITQNGFAVSTITNIVGGTGISVTPGTTGTVIITNTGIDSIQGGTDIAVTTATGNTVINNTSTLQTVTGRGASTTNAINIANTSSATNVNNGALTVAGGVGISGSLYVGGTLIATQLISNGYAVSTATALSIEHNGATIGAANTINFATGTNASYSAGVVTITVDTALNNLQSVTGSGNSTTNTISILNTASNALNVAGGVTVGGDLSVGGTITGGGVRSTTTSTAPANPTVGDIWYDTVTDTVNRFTYDSSSTFWLDITGAAVSNASAVGMTATTIGANLIPTTDVTYTLGDATHRWSAIYVGTGTLYIQDSVTHQNAGLTVANGVLQIQGANQLQVGQLKFVDNTIESTSSNIAIQMGYTGDTANFTVNRNLALASSKTLTFGDGSVQQQAFNSATAVTSIVAGTNITISGSTGAVTINATAAQAPRIISGITTAFTIDFSTDTTIYLHTNAATVTATLTNYTAGKQVNVIVYNNIGGTQQYNHGLSTSNNAVGGTSFYLCSHPTMWVTYICVDNTAGNCFVKASV